MSSIIYEKPTDISTLVKLLKPALAKKRTDIVRMLLALVLLSVAQSMFLLMIGPLFKAAFGGLGDAKDIALQSLIPAQLSNYFPVLAAVSISREQLARFLPLSLLAVAVVKAFATYVFQFRQNILSLYLGMYYREKLFAAILHLPFAKLVDRSPAEWMSVIMHDVQFLQMRLSDLFSGFLRDGTVVISSLAALYFVHWPTALVINVLAIPLMFSSGRTGKKIAHFSEHWQGELARISAAVLDLRRRFEFIRAQGGVDFERERFRVLNHGYYKLVLRSIFIRSALAPSVEFLGFALFAAIVYLVANGHLGKNFGSGDLLQFFAALGILLRPLKSIGEQLSRYHETMGILKSSLDTFKAVEAQRASEVNESVPKQLCLQAPVDLHIRRLELEYKEGFVLQAEDLLVPPATAVALIGPSGAGKSSLLKAIGGLVPPRVWEANQTWREISRSSHLVSQQAFLFSASLRENLTYGLRDQVPSDEDLWAVLAFVDLQTELESKGMTLETELDFLQSPLSGGQLQRLTVARALLNPHPILLFDEVTAAIDPLAEEVFIKRLLEWTRLRGQNLLFVTHRLRQLDLFDHVWFCEDGRVQVLNDRKMWQNDPRIQSFMKAHAVETH